LSGVIESHKWQRICRALRETEVSSLSGQVQDAPVYAVPVRVGKIIWASARAQVRYSILDRPAYIVCAAIGALIIMRSGAVFARVVAVFAE
jgi:hypothetical protein